MADDNAKHYIISYLPSQTLLTRNKQTKKFPLKFDKLLPRSVPDESSSIEKCNWTLNLSSRKFSNAELVISDRTLNYALGKCTVDILQNYWH